MGVELDSQFAEKLAEAFREQMGGGGEAALLQTSTLGPNGSGGQRDALELLAMQREALLTVLLARLSDEERARILKIAAEFAGRFPTAEQPLVLAGDSAAVLRRMNTELQHRVTERTADLRQENAILRAKETWLQRLIDTMPDSFVTIDREGRIVHFNPAAEKIFGYTQAEAVGQKVQLLMPELYAGEHDGYIERYECTGERRALGRLRTITARRKNGELFPIELSMTEVKVGETVRYSAFIRDISEKVQLQERLIEKERLAAIGATAAKLAHEIGNPLNGMFLAAQLLELQLGKLQRDETARNSVRVLRNQIAHLSRLLHEFRSLSRRQQLTLRPTDICGLVREVLTVELSLYTGQGVTVEQLFAPDLPLVQVDQDKFKQVVLNLCKNAVEAMPDGGTLTVRIHNSGSQIYVEITDTGVGVPQDVNIFEPFVTTKERGTGLGLPVVRQIVDAHGGTLTYTSEPGRGTTFVVTLSL